MNENILELHELDELKAAYNLMDERLDGQEIVSDEQLREVMMRKFTDMRQNAKEALIWGNLIFWDLVCLKNILRSVIWSVKAKIISRRHGSALQFLLCLRVCLRC